MQKGVWSRLVRPDELSVDIEIDALDTRVVGSVGSELEERPRDDRAPGYGMRNGDCRRLIVGNQNRHLVGDRGNLEEVGDTHLKPQCGAKPFFSDWKREAQPGRSPSKRVVLGRIGIREGETVDYFSVDEELGNQTGVEGVVGNSDLDGQLLPNTRTRAVDGREHVRRGGTVLNDAVQLRWGAIGRAPSVAPNERLNTPGGLGGRHLLDNTVEEPNLIGAHAVVGQRVKFAAPLEDRKMRNSDKLTFAFELQLRNYGTLRRVVKLAHSVRDLIADGGAFDVALQRCRKVPEHGWGCRPVSIGHRHRGRRRRTALASRIDRLDTHLERLVEHGRIDVDRDLERLGISRRNRLPVKEELDLRDPDIVAHVGRDPEGFPDRGDIGAG